MAIFNCSMDGCEFKTDHVEGSVAAVMLTIHNNVHIAMPTSGTSDVATRHRAPKIERPKISTGSSEETWNTFVKRWTMFQRSTGLTGAESVEQLFHCCDEDLGDSILKGHPDAVTGTEDNMLNVIKQMAVIPVAISVRRADLLTTKQDHGENARAFYAKVRGKASTCKYSIECTNAECNQVIDFTNVMVKDVVISGLVDEDVKKDVLGWTDLDTKSLEDTVSFIEAKEMARTHSAKAQLMLEFHPTRKKEKLEGRYHVNSAKLKLTGLYGTSDKEETLNAHSVYHAGRRAIREKRKERGPKKKTIKQLMRLVHLFSLVESAL